MIERVIALSARNRLLVLLLTGAAALFGWRSMRALPVDALPDLSEPQVIIHSTWDRSPDLVEAQVTYPVVSALLGTPGVKAIRGQSDFGASFVYVVFEENIDLREARSRTLEYVSSIRTRLPEGVQTQLGSEATSLGWVFQYVLVDKSGSHSLADLRSYQDWYLDYQLTAVPGVAEVAPVGGFVKQYQVNTDPNRLRAYGLSIQQVVESLKQGSSNAFGRVIQSGGTELTVRGIGSATTAEDLGETLITQPSNGAPIRIKDVAQVALGSQFRRGLADLDGLGEAVSAIVIVRPGQNALDVVRRIKVRIRQLTPSLPTGVEIVPVYDRSQLIERAITTSSRTVIEVMVTVALITLIFLWHIPSAFVSVVTIPTTILIAFIPFRWLGLEANVMSLGGLAIAVGALVDASIVIVEQTHRRLEEWTGAGGRGEYRAVVLEAAQQVARPAFFALLVTAVSFLPVLALQAEEGRLFRPLAYAKTLGMVIAATLSITLGPALLMLLIRVRHIEFRPEWLCRITNAIAVGKIRSEADHPITRPLIQWYERALLWGLDHKRVIAGMVLLSMLATVPVWAKLGSEFMPPFDEGTLLFMPTTSPNISIGEARRVLQLVDRRLKSVPEVQRVLGKAGRAETATDPAPLSMFETIVVLRPREQWRSRATWYTRWAPSWSLPILRRVTSDRITLAQVRAELEDVARVPGLSTAWTMPIRGRVDMLATGIRTPLGIKVSGGDATQTEQVGQRIATLLEEVSGTRQAFVERSAKGSYVDIVWNRAALARNGFSIDEAQAAVSYAIGGQDVMTLLKGRERYGVNLRYLQDYRANPAALGRVLVSTNGGERHVQLAELADIKTTVAPTMLRSEDGFLTSYVYVDIGDRDIGSYVDEAERRLGSELTPPSGYSYSWSGQYESIVRTRARLRDIIPVTAIAIVVLLYLSTRSSTRTLIVLLAVPFSLIGAIWFLYLSGYHMSVAVWVGLIALLGIDAEMGVFMLLYLDQSYQAARDAGRMNSDQDLRNAIIEGAARRLRPKLMTVAALLVGLLPVMLSSGTGADVMKRIAAPMLGGIVTSFPLELLVYPLVFHAWKTRSRSWHTQPVAR